MTPLFDQDSAPSAENRPSQGVGAATTDQSQTEAREEPEERTAYPAGSDTVEPGPDGGEGIDESGSGNGVDAAPIEKARAEDRAGDGDTNPPARTGAGPGDATTGTAAAEPEAPAAEPQAPAATVPSEAAEPDAAVAAPAEASGPEAPPGAHAEPEAQTPASAGPAWPLPPPPRAEPAPPAPWARAGPPGPAEAEAPTAAATVGPARPLPPVTAAAETVAEPELSPAAPSSAGPAPSLEPPRPAPVGVADRLASRLRVVAHWPEPVRATPDQRTSSLVMLFVLAVTIGAVGAGVLVALVFLFIGALGG
jgi:hypothetical protein